MSRVNVGSVTLCSAGAPRKTSGVAITPATHRARTRFVKQLLLISEVIRPLEPFRTELSIIPTHSSPNASPPRTCIARGGHFRPQSDVISSGRPVRNLSSNTIEFCRSRYRFVECPEHSARRSPNRNAKTRRRLEHSAIDPIDGHHPARPCCSGDDWRRRGRRDVVECDIVNRPFPATGAVVRETETNSTLLARCRQANRFDLPREGAVISFRDIRRQRG